MTATYSHCRELTRSWRWPPSGSRGATLAGAQDADLAERWIPEGPTTDASDVIESAAEISTPSCKRIHRKWSLVGTIVVLQWSGDVSTLRLMALPADTVLLVELSQPRYLGVARVLGEQIRRGALA